MRCGGSSVTKSECQAELWWVNYWLDTGMPVCVPRGQAGMDLHDGLQKVFGRSSASSCILVASALGETNSYHLNSTKATGLSSQLVLEGAPVIEKLNNNGNNHLMALFFFPQTDCL